MAKKKSKGEKMITVYDVVYSVQGIKVDNIMTIKDARDKHDAILKAKSRLGSTVGVKIKDSNSRTVPMNSL